MKDKKVEVYVVTHKLFDKKLCDCYKKIAVGSNLLSDKTFNEYLRDDVGDNISDKNANYCELTAHYWIWKNSKADIVGLCHYRRYFTNKIFSNDLTNIPNADQIQSILDNGYDIILPYRPIARRKVKEIYCDYGFEHDLDILRKIILEKYHDYIGAYDMLMDRHSNYPYNMLICSKKHFNEYSKWLFDILFEVEKRTDLTGYTQQQARIYGFMSERLLEVWVLHNSLKIKHLRVFNNEMKYSLKKRLIDILSIIFNKNI